MPGSAGESSDGQPHRQRHQLSDPAPTLDLRHQSPRTAARAEPKGHKVVLNGPTIRAER